MWRGILIASVAIAFVVAMSGGATAGEMPFAVVGGRVARRFQHLADGDFIVADAFAILAFDQAMALLRRSGLGPAERRGIPPRLQANACRRAHRRGRISRAESHALLRKSRDVRRLHEAAFRVRHVRVHLAGQPAPGLIVREHEKDVGRRGSEDAGGCEQQEEDGFHVVFERQHCQVNIMESGRVCQDWVKMVTRPVA